MNIWRIPRMSVVAVCLAVATISIAPMAWSRDFLDPIEPQIAAAIAASDRLPAERQRLLRTAAESIAVQLTERQQSNVIFICTANSRRSQLGQVWAKVAAMHYGLGGIETYSGGTQATACNPRTVRALRRAGFNIDESAGSENPRYMLLFADGQPPVELYSKRYDDSANPQQNFVAMMCCDDADEACPVVTGAVERFRLSYADPKQADGTPEEDAAYDERSQQIAAEMFFLMKAVADRRK
jgi:arsenate reductase